MDKKIVFSWIVSFALLAIVASAIDWNSAVQQLSRMSVPLVLASSLVYSLSFVFRALRWKYIVKSIAKISVRESFFIVCISFLANNFLPARLGEFLRAYLLSKKKGVGKLKSLSTVIVDRVVDGVTLVFVFFLIMVFSGSVPETVQKIMIVPTVIFAFGMGFFVNPSFFRKIFSPPLKKIPWLYEKAHAFIGDLVVGGKAFSQSIGSNIMIWASSIVIWGLESTNLVIIASGLGLNLSFVEIIILVVVVALGSMIPSAPAYIGTFEALFVASFLAFGLSAESGIAMAITAHAIEFFVILVLGMISLGFFGISWKELLSAKK